MFIFQFLFIICSNVNEMLENREFAYNYINGLRHDLLIYSQINHLDTFQNLFFNQLLLKVEMQNKNITQIEPGFDIKTCFDKQFTSQQYIKDPDYYFDSYSHFSIHQQMLKDSVRTKAYMNAIIGNPQIFMNKVVLDIGSGTGILSIFAARAGAKHVYAIEAASIYIHSRNIIKLNKLDHKITVINGRVEQIELPVQKVDIIISEWMGYFLVYQSMLDTVIFARDKWLKQDGILLPDKASMYIAAIQDEQFYYKKQAFWDDVYGFSMKCLKKSSIASPFIDHIDKQHIISDTTIFFEFDIKTIRVEDLNFEAKFNLNMKRPDTLFGFICWFKTDFSFNSPKITLSTSPYKKTTHWKQTIFSLQRPLPVNYKQEVNGLIRVSKALSNPRQIDVTIQFNYHEEKIIQNYSIN